MHDFSVPLSKHPVSEYQYYEFQAIDRPLGKDEQATLRACSTRARISASRFVNEYHWSGLKADPMKWMKEYFNAHVYLSNFGSRSFHLRFPLALLTSETTRDYEEGGTLETRTTPTHLILSFLCEEESGENSHDDDGEGLLDLLLPIREALSDEAKSFARQLAEFRDLRRRRSSLIARLDQAGLT